MNETLFEQLRGVAQPIEAATGLANPFYVDSDLFEAEKRLVFWRGWAGIGFTQDVPEPGSAFPLTFQGQPLVMIRDREGELRVFHNVCRHRGMILVETPTTLRNVVRCPYHSWCYELNGRLRATPHVGGPGHNSHPCLERDQLGLIEVPSAVLLGTVFVNLDGKARPFRSHAAPLIERWDAFQHRTLHHGGAISTLEFDLQTNWKLAVENYCESYHLPWIHPGLNSYSHLADHYNIVSFGHAGQGTDVYAPDLELAGKRLADFPNLPERWASAAEYVALFPNVLLGVHKDHVFSIVLLPQAADRTLERIALFYANSSITADDHADLRQHHAARWREVFAEDVFVVEGMQRGRASLGFDGGRFSPVMDQATHAFHGWLAAQCSPQG